MAMNPMQRKANNSFLLGILITLLITGTIIGFLIFQVMNLNKEMAEKESTLTKILVLKSDIKSGEILTNDIFTTKEVFSDTVPANAVGTNISALDAYFLADEQGNQAYTGYKLRDPNNILTDYIDNNGDGYKILSESDYNAISEADRALLKKKKKTQYIPRLYGDTSENCEILYDESIDAYYILAPEGNTFVKEVLETMPLIAKIDLEANTVITPEMFAEGQLTSNDVRTQEYSTGVIQVPSQLSTGEYIDIRIRTPEGRDLLVISKKEVTIPEYADGTISSTSFWMNLSEEETLMMSCAIVESYEMNGARLYATRYVEPGMQNQLTTTYVPSAEVEALIERDPNIVQEAKNALNQLIDSNRDLVRPGIENATNHEDAADNVSEKTQEEITTMQDEREQYVESLGY